MNILIVVDMQNDFIDGSLGTKEAVAIVPKVVEKMKHFDGMVLATRDTHPVNYPETPVIVDAACCAGVTPESHERALEAMKMCQIQVV